LPQLEQGLAGKAKCPLNKTISCEEGSNISCSTTAICQSIVLTASIALVRHPEQTTTTLAWQLWYQPDVRIIALAVRQQRYLAATVERDTPFFVYLLTIPFLAFPFFLFYLVILPYLKIN
jgi:hypothetical protein